MATLSVNVSEEVRELARARAAEQGYATVDAYLAKLIEADAAVPVSDELEAAIVAGLASPSRDMTPADWDQMRSQFRASRSGGGVP